MHSLGFALGADTEAAAAAHCNGVEEINRSPSRIVFAVHVARVTSGTRIEYLRRLRSRLKNVFIFSKLREARSLLYRHRFLQPNSHFAAFFENYKIYILLHRSEFKISAKNSSQFWSN